VTNSARFDVAVAGAGPAGCAAAIRLVRSGLRVIMIEQKRFPREKLCGEFVSPECLSHFQVLGIDLGALRGSTIARAVFYTVDGRPLSVSVDSLGLPGRKGLGISRAAMDHALLVRARDAGVHVLEDTTVKGALSSGGKVTGLRIRNNGTETEVSASLVIDARGRTKPFFGVPYRDLRPARQVAFKTHLKGAETAPAVCEMFIYKGGYGGCLPVEGGMHNLCFIARASDVRDCGSEPERYLRTIIMTNRRAATVLAKAKVVGDWHAVPIQGLGRRDPVEAPGILAVGDAAAFIDPFTGSGILLALQSAELAAEIIARCYPDLDLIEREYQAAYARRFHRRLRASALLRYAFKNPAATEVALRVFGSSERLLHRLAVTTRADNTAGV
jgi:menaquinone-9 beta-reductase